MAADAPQAERPLPPFGSVRPEGGEHGHIGAGRTGRRGGTGGPAGPRCDGHRGDPALVAEFVGTFVLVFAIISTAMAAGLSHPVAGASVDSLTIALVNGIALATAVFIVGALVGGAAAALTYRHLIGRVVTRV